MKKVLSCIQPTGEMHIGNYFGAIKNWVDIQDQYECIYGIVDLHAMTMPYNPDELKENTFRMAADLMACGIDPSKSILFTQSLVPEHTELTWIFNCVTSYGELAKMAQFKDKSSLVESDKSGDLVSAGLFTYPVLQAADILIYNADLVPVGKDQEQHLELTRNIAVRFNNKFEQFFTEPKPLFTEVPKLLSLADPTKKMSKSYGKKHYISLFEEDESIRKKIRSAVTDTGEKADELSPGVANLFNLLRACDKTDLAEDMEKQHASGSLKYKDLKDNVADALIEMIQPLRDKRKELLNDRAFIENKIKDMSHKARELAQDTLKNVRDITGLPPMKR